MAILSSREQKWDYFFWSGKKDAIIVSHVSNINDSNRTDYMYEILINLISCSGSLYFDISFQMIILEHD